MRSCKRTDVRLAILIILGAASLGNGAFEHTPLAPMNVGMGLMVVNGSLQPTGILNDPASSVQMTTPQMFLSWGNRFGLKTLLHQSAAVSYPLSVFNLGVGVTRFGNSLYQETTITVLTGKRVKPSLDVGIAITLYQLFIKDYSSQGTMGITISSRWHLAGRLECSTTLQNVNNPRLSGYREPLPQIITTGVSYVPVPHIKTILEWEQDLEYPGRAKFGVLCRPFRWLRFALGYAANPGQVTGGVELTFQFVSFNYAATTHAQLGLSHWLGLGFNLP